MSAEGDQLANSESSLAVNAAEMGLLAIVQRYGATVVRALWWTFANLRFGKQTGAAFKRLKELLIMAVVVVGEPHGGRWFLCAHSFRILFSTVVVGRDSVKCTVLFSSGM